jgi:hypothetical protein
MNKEQPTRGAPVRRIATVVPAAIATVVAVLTLSTGTALAHDKGGSGHAKASHAVTKAEHKGEHKGEHGQKGEHHKVKPLLTLVGVVSDTPTTTIGSGSDTATSTITLDVRGGKRGGKAKTAVLTVDKSTVVRRGDAAATAADLKPGDVVVARVRRMPDGSLLALRVRAWAPRVHHEDDSDQPAPAALT